MNKRGCIALVTLTSAALLGTATFAQQAAPQATAPDELQSAARTAAQNPVDEARAAEQRVAPEKPVVFNGGISLEERASAPDEGTKLEFFLTGGAYLSDVHVVVEDNEGNEVVNTVTDGPWLILDLPDGEYDVHASLNDDLTQSGKIMVDSRSEKYGYMFASEAN